MTIDAESAEQLLALMQEYELSVWNPLEVCMQASVIVCDWENARRRANEREGDGFA